MTGRVLLTIGNAMMGDDGAGPMLAARLERSPASGWQVVDGSSVPENVMHHVRALQPQQVLLVDATEMELAPGEVRLVDDGFIADRFIMTTHDMPLSFLIASLRETVPDVRLLGIQPSVVAFAYPMSAAVKQAVDNIHEALRRGASPDAWPPIEVSERRTTGGN